MRMFLWLTLLTGVVYPLLITVIAQVAMPFAANGSLVETFGSKQIAQRFESDRYFWPRPSAVDYNPLPSGGSNLGPISLNLKQTVEKRKAKFGKDAPSEMLFASGSGLDPHISPETAYYQIERVAKARGIDPKTLRNLVDQEVEKPLFGPPIVNVFLLNLKIDKYGTRR